MTTLNDIRIEKAKRKYWTDDKALNTKILTNPNVKRNVKTLHKLFHFAPGPTKTFNKSLPPMEDPDKDGIPNWADKRPFIKDKNIMQDIMKRKSPVNKLKRFRI